MLVDTHCHLHDSEFYTEGREAAYKASIDAGVAMICVGTDERSSNEAVAFCKQHALTWPVVGVHPHEAKNGWQGIAELLVAERESIIGIGEIGLDYYYDHSPKPVQIEALEAQIQLALDNNLPISFHVRDAFDDFWPIFDNFTGIRGVLHSFTDTAVQAEQGFTRGLYIGVNGISTFTKNSEQVNFFTSVPVERIILETDAPYLTPSPFRGKMNIPAYVGSVAEFHAHARGMSLDALKSATTANAEVLFGVKFNEQYQQLRSSLPPSTGFDTWASS